MVELGGESFIVREDEGGLIDAAMTLAMVKVLPEPVTPRRTWCFSPALRPSVSCSMAWGWSPRGS